MGGSERWLGELSMGSLLGEQALDVVRRIEVSERAEAGMFPR